MYKKLNEKKIKVFTLHTKQKTTKQTRTKDHINTSLPYLTYHYQKICKNSNKIQGDASA